MLNETSLLGEGGGGDEAGHGCSGPGSHKRGDGRGDVEKTSDFGFVLIVEPRLRWAVGPGAWEGDEMSER